MITNGCRHKNFKKIKNLLVVILLILLPIILRFISLSDLEKAPTICIYKNMTGKDCWGCGTSRALVSILNFDFKQAYQFNKRIVIVFPLLVFLWVKVIVKNIKILFRKDDNIPVNNKHKVF